MAVDKLKVIARLKALFPKANLSQKRLDAIADKLAKKLADDADYTAIDAVINDFNELMSIEDIAKDDDRLRTLEAEKNKPKPTDPPKPDPNNPNPNPEPPKPDNTPDWAKSMAEKLDKVTTELETIKSGKITETKLQTAQSLIENSEVLKVLKPEHKASWIKRIDLNSETPFEEQIASLETEYKELVQTNVDATAYAGPAGGGKAPSTVDEKYIENIVSEM